MTPVSLAAAALRGRRGPPHGSARLFHRPWAGRRAGRASARVRRPVDGVVLAAGTASRLGLPKFALPAGPGETFLTRALTIAHGACDGAVHVVAGRDADLAAAEVSRWKAFDPGPRSHVALVLNEAFEQGLSTSLRLGIARAAAGGAEGALVVLADQPAVSPERARALVETFASSDEAVVAVAPAADGEQRNPVVLGQALFGELDALTGDHGARRVLRGHGAGVTLVEWGPGPWTRDVDTWDDYALLAREAGWQSSAPSASPAALDELRQEWNRISHTALSPVERLAALRRLVVSSVP